MLSLDVAGVKIPLDEDTLEPQLLQTWWYGDPWRVCVTSILIGGGRQAAVEPLLRDFYEEYPSPEIFFDHPRGAILRAYLVPLGILDQGEIRLYEFTYDLLAGKPVRECRGCSAYVEESYRLVHLKDDTTITDFPDLMVYRAWLHALPDDPLRWA